MSRFRASNKTDIDNLKNLAEYADLWGYNLDHLDGLHSLLSAGGIKPIVFLGDSITEGQVSTTAWRQNGFAGRLETMLKAIYGNGGAGFVPAWAYKSSGTLEIPVSGGNTLAEHYRTLNAAASGSYSDSAGIATGMDFYYEKFDGAGKLTAGKGANFQAIQLQNATPLIGKLEFTGWTPTVGNITFWMENNPGRVIGLVLKQSSITKGVLCHNLGFTTKTGAAWLDPAGNGADVETIVADLAPKLEIIAFGANDYNNQTVVATYKASVKDAVDKALARGCKVLLVNTGVWAAEIPTDPKAIAHLTYEKAIYEIATESNVALCDVNAKWRSFGKNKFLSYLQDATIHPNDKGHIDITNSIMACLYNR